MDNLTFRYEGVTLASFVILLGIFLLLSVQGCAGLTFLAGLPQSGGELISFIIVIVIALLIIVPIKLKQEEEKHKKAREDEEIRQYVLRKIRKETESNE